MGAKMFRLINRRGEVNILNEASNALWLHETQLYIDEINFENRKQYRKEA